MGIAYPVILVVVLYLPVTTAEVLFVRIPYVVEVRTAYGAGDFLPVQVRS